MTAPARTPEFLALQSQYHDVMRRIVQLNALLPQVQGDEAALDMVIAP